MISTPAHVDHVRIFILNSEICHRKRSLSPKSRLLEVPFDNMRQTRLRAIMSLIEAWMMNSRCRRDSQGAVILSDETLIVQVIQHVRKHIAKGQLGVHQFLGEYIKL